MTSGPSHNPRGFVLIALLLALSGGAIAGGVFLSHRARRFSQSRSTLEDQNLAHIVEGFRRFVTLHLSIPGPENWTEAVASVTSMTQADIQWVHPHLPSESTGRRILLVDPSLPEHTLPYFQSPSTLLHPSSALLSEHARLLVVSSSHPKLALPFQSGTPDASAFNELWNWSFQITSGTAPSSWPNEWNDNGLHLHVARISLRDHFAQIQFQHLHFATRSNAHDLTPAGPEHPALSPLNGFLLKGTPLHVFQTNGVLHQIRVIQSNESFDLTPPEPPTPGEPSDSSGSSGNPT